ncbi:hypothetical protein E2562_011845 [Oryza meyeriana var. granulata]|uniref:Uncharacterized protein n=1 Tax=Oryza meyeriana var. granulata TaxID=110450 RepID=A0A6G1CPH5_9ORYZ|nr:hypothetical protein E2562_011845 [Oryza meyeriana var. granulata]
MWQRAGTAGSALADTNRLLRRRCRVGCRSLARMRRWQPLPVVGEDPAMAKLAGKYLSKQRGGCEGDWGHRSARRWAASGNGEGMKVIGSSIGEASDGERRRGGCVVERRPAVWILVDGDAMVTWWQGIGGGIERRRLGFGEEEGAWEREGRRWLRGAWGLGSGVGICTKSFPIHPLRDGETAPRRVGGAWRDPSSGERATAPAGWDREHG